MSITPQAVKEAAAAIEADFRAENPDTDTDTAKKHVWSVLGGSYTKIVDDIERNDVAACTLDAVKRYTNGKATEPPVNDNATTDTDNPNPSPLMDMDIEYSVVSKHVQASTRTATVREYFEIATEHKVGKKDSLGIPLSVYRPLTPEEAEKKTKTDENGNEIKPWSGPYRSLNTLVTCYGLSVDIDDKLQLADFIKRMEESGHGYGYAAATTYSHGSPEHRGKAEISRDALTGSHLSLPEYLKRFEGVPAELCDDLEEGEIVDTPTRGPRQTITHKGWDRYRVIFIFDQPIQVADYGENFSRVGKLAISSFLDSIGLPPDLYDKNATEGLVTNFYAPRHPNPPFTEPEWHIQDGKPVPFTDFMDTAKEAVGDQPRRKARRRTAEPGELLPLPVMSGDKPVCLPLEEWCAATKDCFNICDALDAAGVEFTDEPADSKVFYPCPHKQHGENHKQITYAYNPGEKARLADPGWGAHCSGECSATGHGDTLSQLSGLISTGMLPLELLADEQFYLPGGVKKLQEQYQFRPYIEELARLLSADSMAAYDKRKQELADKLGVSKTALDKDAKQLREARKREETAARAAEEEASEETEEEKAERLSKERQELAKQAGDLWTATDIPAVLAKEFHDAGVVAEDVVLKALFLSAVARWFKKNIHVVVTGASASGKSYLTGEIVKTLPDDAVIQTTSISPKFIFYDEETQWQYGIFYMQELSPLQNEDNDELTYIIRQVMSESRIDHRTIIDGKAEHLSKDGPITFWATTTADEWHAENDTRVIRIHTDETSDQTTAIAKKIAEKHGPDAPPEMSKEQLARWHAFHELIAIGPKKAVVLFASTITELLNPPLPVRIRRDVEKLFSLISAHALTHQYNRELDANGRVIATLGDYEAVLPIIDRAIAESTGQRASDREIRIVDHVLSAIEKQQAAANHAGGPEEEKKGTLKHSSLDADTLEISTRVLSEQLGIERNTTYRTLQAVLDAGYLVNVQTLPRHPYQLKKGKRDLVGVNEDGTVFPTVEQVREAWTP